MAILQRSSARSKRALFVVVAVAVVAAPLLMHDDLLAAAAKAADGGGSGSGQMKPEGILYAGCFRAGGCKLTPEWCPVRCVYLGFSPGAGCEVMDDGHIYCCCGPSRTSAHADPSTKA
uniref:Uncharacterized protein n=1 Tax=Oryza rufipogon TaxID=4529 RepID=A0A0E0R523_ORYRU